MVARDSRYSVLFVCTGNTCRSPLAVAALLQELGPGARRVQVASAGTAAWDGQPASEHSALVAGREGIDLSAHRARRATSELLQDFDLVLGMERSHVTAVEALGVGPGRAFVLSEWPAPGEPELTIFDPMGGSIEAYEECWRRIRRHVRRVAPQVLEAARARSV